VENYFNYFTEIEEHFQRRRGRLQLSPMDWALIETWKDAGMPLEAVLRGIDAAFDKYEQRPSKSQKVNSLAYCAQAVLTAADDMKEAAVGAASPDSPSDRPSGFQVSEISAFLRRNAEQLDAAKLPQAKGIDVTPLARETASTLREIAAELEATKTLPRLEDLERRLAVAEEKLFAVLLATTPDEQIVTVRAQADRELAPYRRKMPSAQIEQLQKQYVHRSLLEKYGLPRLSLFYM
jgi:DNA-binding transcriptional MerR regulator